MSSAQISELESGVKDKYLESNLFHYTKSNQKQEKFLQNQDQADMQLTPESSDDDDCKNIDLEDYNNLIIQTSTNANKPVVEKLQQ